MTPAIAYVVVHEAKNEGILKIEKVFIDRAEAVNFIDENDFGLPPYRSIEDQAEWLNIIETEFGDL